MRFFFRSHFFHHSTLAISYPVVLKYSCGFVHSTNIVHLSSSMLNIHLNLRASSNTLDTTIYSQNITVKIVGRLIGEHQKYGLLCEPKPPGYIYLVPYEIIIISQTQQKKSIRMYMRYSMNTCKITLGDLVAGITMNRMHREYLVRTDMTFTLLQLFYVPFAFM
jgi:hypothetical protein